MKILNITAQKPHSTGSGTYMTELIRAFDRMGHRQTVIAGVYPDDAVSFPENVKFYPVYFDVNSNRNEDATIRSGYVPYPIVGMSDEMPYISTRYRDMTEGMVESFGKAFIEVISKAVAELKPDIIICHHLFLLTAMVRKNFPDETIYGVCHGSDLRQMKCCQHLHDYVRPAIAALDKIFVLHDEQARDVIGLYGAVTENKVEVIGSGYNENLFNIYGRVERSEDDPVRICYAGKMSSAKGVPELLEVLDELAARTYVGKLPSFTATLFGGCQDETIKERLKNMPSCVKYAGQIPQFELATMFKQGDIFILPSYYEGLGLVLIEAMASGMIPISTDLPGIQDWIDANVRNSNIRFIPRPEMKGIDEPTEKGKIIFIENMTEILGQTIKDVAEGLDSDLFPDTSGITWMGVATKIIPY